MALRLDQLIKMSNLSAQVKEDALKNIDTLNEDQKARLSQVCWESISLMYENKARLDYDRMLEEMANEEKEYSPSDFAAIDDKIISDILLRLDSLQTKEELESAKKDLQQIINNKPR